MKMSKLAAVFCAAICVLLLAGCSKERYTVKCVDADGNPLSGVVLTVEQDGKVDEVPVDSKGTIYLDNSKKGAVISVQKNPDGMVPDDERFFTLGNKDIEIKFRPGRGLSFKSEDLDGNPVDTTIFNGYDLIIVNMWAEWCRFSPRELQALQKISQEYADKKVLVLGVVDADGDKDGIRRMVSEAGVTYPVVYYNDDFSNVDTYMYRPESVLLSKNGEVIPVTAQEMIEPQAELIRTDAIAYKNGEYNEYRNNQAYWDYFSKLVNAYSNEEYLMELAEMYARGSVQTTGEFSGDLTYEGWKILIDDKLSKLK